MSHNMWGALANATDKHLQNTSKSERNADAQHNAIGDPLSHSAPPLNIDAKDTDLGNMRKEVPQSALERMKHVTKIIHHHRGKKMNLATALMSHSKLAGIVNGQRPSPPQKKKGAALQKFKARKFEGS